MPLTNTVQFRAANAEGECAYPAFAVAPGQAIPANIACHNSCKVSLVTEDADTGWKYVYPLEQKRTEFCTSLPAPKVNAPMFYDGHQGLRFQIDECICGQPYLKLSYCTVRCCCTVPYCTCWDCRDYKNMSLCVVLPGFSGCMPLCMINKCYYTQFIRTQTGSGTGIGTLRDGVGAVSLAESGGSNWSYGSCDRVQVLLRMPNATGLLMDVNLSSSCGTHTHCCQLPSAAWN